MLTISPLQSTSATISVRYPPLVNLTQLVQGGGGGGGGLVREGALLKLVCQAEGNPEQFRYKWSVDDHNVNGEWPCRNLVQLWSLCRDGMNIINQGK